MSDVDLRKGLTAVEQTFVATRDPELVWRPLDDELVIVRPADGQIRVLNGVGSFIWQLLDGQRAVCNLAEMVADEYQVSPGEAELDIGAFLGELADDGLVKWTI